MNPACLKRSRLEIDSPIDALSAKRTQTTLETVPDDLDDAAHARVDDAVFEIFEDEPSYPFTLLATVASTSEVNLDPKYKENPNAKTLLQEHPSLTNKLIERSGRYGT